MNNFLGLYNIRPATKNDHNFILATFLRGIYYGDTFFSQVDKTLFMDKYKLVAQALVNDPSTVIRIACLPDDQDVILGYSISSNADTTLNWIFVKDRKGDVSWRRKGIAKSLLPPQLKAVVPQHITKIGSELLPKLNRLERIPFF